MRESKVSEGTRVLPLTRRREYVLNQTDMDGVGKVGKGW